MDGARACEPCCRTRAEYIRTLPWTSRGLRTPLPYPGWEAAGAAGSLIFWPGGWRASRKPPLPKPKPPKRELIGVAVPAIHETAPTAPVARRLSRHAPHRRCSYKYLIGPLRSRRAKRP